MKNEQHKRRKNQKEKDPKKTNALAHTGIYLIEHTFVHERTELES